MRTLKVDDPRDILAWDLADLLGADAPTSTVTEAVLVCTNARRDQCCALLGRPLVATFVDKPPTPDTQIWETSHLGGHRFAPTFVDLPSGYRLRWTFSGRPLTGRLSRSVIPASAGSGCRTGGHEAPWLDAPCPPGRPRPRDGVHGRYTGPRDVPCVRSAAHLTTPSRVLR